MNPWEILSWVAAISLMIFLAGTTILFIRGFFRAIFKTKREKEVSIFRGMN